ncbi:MAG TPA: ATP-binding protein [Chthoniobacterales bacterium]|jgi:two-component system phosphate regulon sensor histidine kinase PhoR
MSWIWVALAFAVALLLYGSWRVWREWIEPTRHLDRLVQSINANETPSTFLIGDRGRMRRIGLALEEISLRQKNLSARAEEGEFGVQAITGAMAEGVVVADGERRIRLMNRAFKEMFGVDGLTTETSLLEAARDATVDRLLGETLAQGTTQRGAITLPGERHLEVTGEPIRGHNGTVSGAVMLFRDVSGMRRTETMRRDFVANVSHELRTPLSILRGYLETLLENPKQPPAELLRIFEVMERHSNRLNLLVDDVLSLARLEGPGATLDLATVRPAEFLRGVMRDWEKRFEAKNLHGELDLPNDLPLLQADEGRLQEIVYNLLDNAVKYSEPAGRIIVRATAPDGQFCLSVTDTGPGIPGCDLPRIFERFYRGDRSRQREQGGTGLGLSIVKHIAQLHGGSVAAESEPGRGTTVRVYLPLAAVTKS